MQLRLKAAGTSPFRVFLPLGKKGAVFTFAVGIITSLCISLGTSDRDATAYPSNLCNSGGVDYTQTGSPYGVQSPDLHGSYFMSHGSRCFYVGDWTPTYLNYWHLLLNGLYWTGVVYVMLLVWMHTARHILRARRQ